jgi:hypothetical protein
MRLNKEVLNLPALEPAVTEVAILATQGHYTGSSGGGFLTYSHSRIVASKGLLTEEQMKKRVNAILGKDQTLHVIQLVAYYSLHGVTLNAGIIGAPEGERIWKL